MSDDRSDRRYPARPLVGVGAVVWDGSRVLLERRGKPPAQGTWSLPGGLIELGETAEEAVRREVAEECGIEVTVGPLLGLFEPIDRDQEGRVRFHFVVLDFLARYRSGELRAGDDAADLCWVPYEELSRYPLMPPTRAMIDRSLARLTADDGAARH
jgi:8-oxo-dGTP diphosphatase